VGELKTDKDDVEAMHGVSLECAQVYCFVKRKIVLFYYTLNFYVTLIKLYVVNLFC
jgi:hypothetical protein